MPKTATTLRALLSAGAAFAMVSCAPLPAPQTMAAAPQSAAAPQINEATLRSVTTRLASDEFEGRGPGTVGEERSIAYIIEQMRAAGLQPGNHGSWTQTVPLVEMRATNVSPLTFTTPRGTQSLTVGEDFVANSFRLVPHTAISNSDVVFVGYGINAPEKGWNDYAGVDVRGKTVLILVNDPDWETPTVGGEFNGRAMTYYGRWTYKYEEAARQGAAAAIIVHDTEPAAYGWNVVRTSNTGNRYHIDAADGHAGETAANGWIQLERTRALFTAAGLNFDALRTSAKQRGFRAVPLTGVQASLSFDSAMRRAPSQNVIGILPGRTRPDEQVLYTAHWDHLGQCRPNATGDHICNGAIDNATGVGAMMALAEAHHNAGPADRSLVFLAVTAEEQGLLGSLYYAQNPVFPLWQTAGGVNMDALPATAPARDVVIVGQGKSELDTLLAAAVTAAGRTMSPDPTPEKGHYYRSDHFSLAKYGVPMFNFGSGDDLIEGGRAAGAAASADYVTNYYHSPDDEIGIITRWDGMIADVRLFYSVGRSLAMSDAWPNWLPGDEFRAVRDASRAGH